MDARAVSALGFERSNAKDTNDHDLDELEARRDQKANAWDVLFGSWMLR